MRFFFSLSLGALRNFFVFKQFDSDVPWYNVLYDSYTCGLLGFLNLSFKSIFKFGKIVAIFLSM